jgi:hypothetical protein
MEALQKLFHGELPNFMDLDGIELVLPEKELVGSQTSYDELEEDYVAA